MKTLVHYQNILNSVFSFGTRQPLEHMDRLWENLRTSGLEVYISSRGLDTVWREVSSHSGIDFANRVRANIEGVLRICPPVSLQQVRDFAHRYGGNSYEEAIEIYSAFSISAQYIFSNSPQAFRSFNLTEIPLSQNPDLSFLRNYRVPNSLPVLLVGDLSNIWFLASYVGSNSNPSSVNLKQWFRGNRFEHSWYPVEELNIEPCVKPAYRFKNVRRGKLISLRSSDQPGLDSVALIVAVSNPLREFNVTIELIPTNVGDILPDFLKLEVFDADGKCVEQEISNRDSAIFMKIEGEESEPFSIQISYKNFVHQENFLL